MPFKPGESGNPLGAGIYKNVPKNKVLKDGFKVHSKEALDHVVAYMRKASKSISEVEAQIEILSSVLASAEESGDTETAAETLKEITSLRKSCESAEEKTLKASIKILDYTYNIVLSEDRLAISKKALKQTKQPLKEVGPPETAKKGPSVSMFAVK